MTKSANPYARTGTPIAIAHRGGGREFPENSLTAFREVVNMGYTHIETDMRATRDGSVMIFHDANLNRVTNGVGRISELPYSEVAKAKIAGKDQIMTLQELLEEFPDTAFNLDVKDDQTVEPFIAAMKQTQAFDRVCVGSFSGKRLKAVRKELGPKLATGMAPSEVSLLASASRAGRFGANFSDRISSSVIAAQVPIKAGRIPIVTQAFVHTAHRIGLAVHVWTIDETDQMERLLDLGVDGIMTDRPTRLLETMGGDTTSKA
ncbi:MAG: glycerophosphodiester phosphodiesterase [Candidatus Nanopelagicales bacterium]